MPCYKDTTFCRQWELCAKGKGCKYALTIFLLDAADKAGLPISQVDRRECFEPRSRSIERRLSVEETWNEY